MKRKSRARTYHVNAHGTRRFRKQMQAGCRQGVYPLRLVGDVDSGYRLGAERGNNVVLFGQWFEKQAAAVAWAVEHLGHKPIKLMAALPMHWRALVAAA
jgi:hypothetical protein